MDKINTEEPVSPQYECDYCHMKFRSKRVMSRHILSHTNAEPVCCEVCGGEFPNIIALEQHERKHDRKNKYKCRYCLESFRRQCKFTKHLKTHEGPHPYECPICFDSFATEDYFQLHLKTHKKLEPKSFVCNNCKKKFAHLAMLNRHMLTHYSIKPYPCVLCDKAFPDVSTRSRHVKNHAPLCLLCDKRPFKNFATLRNHIEQIHRKKTQIKIAGNKQSEIERHENENILLKEDENEPNRNIILRDDPLNCSRIKNLVETISESGETDEKSVTGQISKITVNNNNMKPEVQTLHLDVKPEVQTLHLDVKPEVQNLSLDVNNQCQTMLSMVPWIGNQNQLMPQNFPVASVMPSAPFSLDFFINWLKNFTNQCKLLKYPVEGSLLTKINQVQKYIFELLASDQKTGVFSQKKSFEILLEINEILEKIISDNMQYKLNMLAML